MKPALIDTDILSELFRAKHPHVQTRAAAYLTVHDALSISTMTLAEVVHGWHQAKRPERAEIFRAWLKDNGTKILELDEGASWLVGEIGGALARAGKPIGLADVVIAATAIHHGRVLVTGNTDHHERIRAAGFELELENWRAP